MGFSFGNALAAIEDPNIRACLSRLGESHTSGNATLSTLVRNNVSTATITAGNGLTGGGALNSITSITLDVGAGFGMAIAADAVAVAQDMVPDWTGVHRHSNYVEYDEMAAPGTPAANRVRLYAKDKAGVSNLYFKRDNAAEVDLSVGGTVTGTGTTNYVTKWTNGAGGVLGDSVILEDSAQFFVTFPNVGGYGAGVCQLTAAVAPNCGGIYLAGGNSNTATSIGGIVELIGGQGDAEGGGFNLVGGPCGGSGPGGTVGVYAGYGGPTAGAGGDIFFTAGDAQGGVSRGGNITFTAGVKSGAGANGQFLFGFGGFTGELIFSTMSANRAYTFPNATGTLTLLSLAQTWSATQTFTPQTVHNGGIDCNGALDMSSQNIVTNAGTGTKIGTATTQLLSLWNKAPIVQPAGALQAVLTNSTGGSQDGTLVDVATAGVADSAKINSNFTDVFALLDAMRTAMVNFGSMKGAA